MSGRKKQILVLNGPNLNLLGFREPEIYGKTTLDEIHQELKELGEKLGAEVKCFQSNHEGELVDWLHEYRLWADGIIINPGALTHYGLSLHDAILAVNRPTVEVHLSNIYSREEWRRKSVISPACVGIIAGFGKDGYAMALQQLLKILEAKPE
ncbi:MAG TPA: type II 3-dehydroquinate dehydratase [Bacteroidetes bacterium]|nr:type II 3-dehydroquinate dehydratase [Bacteroidota bacterium]